MTICITKKICFRLTLYIAIYFHLPSQLCAQEPAFSQYMAAPNLLNPAASGIFQGKYSFQGNFKHQWTQVMYPYVTGVLDAQMHVMDNLIGNNDIATVSLVGVLDRSNDGGLRKSQIGAAFSFHKSLDQEGEHRFGIGLQALYNNTSIDFTRLTFQSQFRPYIGYDTRINSGEGAGVNAGAFDYSAGVLYSYINDDITAFIGASAFHLNNLPIETPYGRFTIPTRMTYHGGLSFSSFETDRIYSSLSHITSNVTNQTTLSIVYGKNLNGIYEDETNEFLLGAFIRFKDAIAPFIGYRRGNLSVGLNYDFTVSDLRMGNQTTGSLELGIQYRIPESIFKNERKKLKCKFVIW